MNCRWIVALLGFARLLEPTHSFAALLRHRHRRRVCHYLRDTSVVSIPTKTTSCTDRPMSSKTSIEAAATDPAMAAATCKFCKESFSTRNRLFQHIRDVHDTHNEMEVWIRRSILIHFGTHLRSSSNSSYSSTDSMEMLREAVLQTLPRNCKLVSCTQSSVAASRPDLLGDDDAVPAAEDAFVMGFLGPANWTDTFVVPTLPKLEIFGWREMPLTSTVPALHAEHGCTQHVFRYLLPASWLPCDVVALKEWHLQGQPNPTPVILKQLKDALRKYKSTYASQYISRYGGLAHKSTLSFHNHVTNATISPSHDIAQRCVDQIRMVDMAITPNGEAVVVVEVSGDEFLRTQIPHMIGVCVAMLHGWLPDHFVELATDKNRIIETPAAPISNLFRAGARFHYTEQYFKGEELLVAAGTHRVNNSDPVTWMQEALVSRLVPDTCWLDDLQKVVTPRIRGRLAAESNHNLTIVTSATPPAYVPTLQHLQHIVDTKTWPSTSVARSSVISTAVGKQQQSGGSFTVISDRYFDTSALEKGLPQANMLFPDLTNAVFDLEDQLIAELAANGSDRPRSSHCAVNANAQFTPHLDSGQGAGQSVSMIVGLGNYGGGDLLVEGDAHNIRYTPLQFDGWKQRHWTHPFAGQRFSLVWFTPKGVKPLDVES